MIACLLTRMCASIASFSISYVKSTQTIWLELEQNPCFFITHFFSKVLIGCVGNSMTSKVLLLPRLGGLIPNCVLLSKIPMPKVALQLLSKALHSSQQQNATQTTYSSIPLPSITYPAIPTHSPIHFPLAINIRRRRCRSFLLLLLWCQLLHHHHHLFLLLLLHHSTLCHPHFLSCCCQSRCCCCCCCG